MNRLAIFTATIAACFIGGCDQDKFAVNAKGITGYSGTGMGAGKGGITGHWEFVESATGIASHRAGACLVESLSDFTGKTEECQDVAEASDCAAKLPTNLKNARYASYCVPDTKTCWVRPENQGEPVGAKAHPEFHEPHRLISCNRSIDYSPLKEWQPGQYVTNEVPATPPPGRKTHWRVIACIIGEDGCKESLGPVTELDAVGVSPEHAMTQNTPGLATPSPESHP